MKKRIIWGIVGLGLLLGGAGAAQAASVSLGAASESSATQPVSERLARVRPPLRCDEGRIASCNTSCRRTCVRGPRYAVCTTDCDRTCRARYCR
jgi:hypothetical protein